MSRRTGRVLAGLLLAALVVAGLLSAFASGSPDGLTAVSEDKGFASTETEHAAADSPLAGYETRGVMNERLSVGLAGVIGVVVTFGIGAGLFLLVRGGDRTSGRAPDGATSTTG